jgi:aminoglycoside phosphotransferase (APT) family kinase protein
MTSVARDMHEGQLRSDVELVRRILRDQHPKWADGPIAEIPSTGTDHALYRLGDDAVARVPLRQSATRPIETEFRWLPWLAERLPIEVPRPLARVEPSPAFPYRWSVHSWIDGECGTTASIDRDLLAVDMAGALRALHALEPLGPPSVHAYCLRGIPLELRDQTTREAITASRQWIDVAAVTRAWETALDARAWTDRPMWVHGDLAAGNMIFRDGRLVALIDWACMAVGDPACDLIVAWELFDEAARATLRAEVGIDDATWERARGWALSTAVGALAYYERSNPFMADQARHKLRALLGEHAVRPPVG